MIWPNVGKKKEKANRFYFKGINKNYNVYGLLEFVAGTR